MINLCIQKTIMSGDSIMSASNYKAIHITISNLFFNYLVIGLG